MKLLAFLALFSPAIAAPAPLRRPSNVGSRISDKYIVKFKDDSALSTFSETRIQSTLESLSVQADRIYTSIFRGFAGSLDADTLQLLREHPDVEYIEQDAKSLGASDTLVTQPNAPWALSRISQRTVNSTDYVYDESAGRGTCVYVIDTGIDTTHPEFGGRAFWGVDLVSDYTTDGMGLGTAHAGAIGSAAYGVAKLTTLIAIRTIDHMGEATISRAIAALDWLSKDSATRDCPNGVMVAVLNELGYSAALNHAAAELVKSGVFVAHAAQGWHSTNITDFSPASEPLVCTTAGTDQTDAPLSASKFGPLLDVWAPASPIVTAWPVIDGGINYLAGTLLSVAHVTGLAAYLAALEGIEPSKLCDRIKELATPDVLTGIPEDTNNLLIFNGNPEA